MENELIKISKNENGELLVSARDLHEFLEIKTEFRKWMLRMIEYGFEENIDFVKVTQKCPTSSTGQNKVNYALKIDMAKEIAMIQRNDKGKVARLYFIDNGSNVPYQKYIDRRYFVCTQVVTNNHINVITKVTTKGQEWLFKKFPQLKRKD